MIPEIITLSQKGLHWIEGHPAFSNGASVLLGVVLGAILDVKQRYITFVQKVGDYDSSKKTVIVSFLNGCFNKTQNHVSEQRVGDDLRQPELRSPAILTPIRRNICTKVKDFSESRTNQSFNPEPLYEKFTRALDSPGEFSIAVNDYIQLSGRIFEIIQPYAMREGSTKQISNLKAVIKGLVEMSAAGATNNKIIKQISDCDNAILAVFSSFRL